MCAVTHRANPYLLALLIKKSLDDITGTQQRACEATLQYQYQNIHFFLNYALFVESSIDTFKEMCKKKIYTFNFICVSPLNYHHIQIKFTFKLRLIKDIFQRGGGGGGGEATLL